MILDQSHEKFNFKIEFSLFFFQNSIDLVIEKTDRTREIHCLFSLQAE